LRSWRNWQTHQLEGLAVAIPWWFESTRPHHFLGKGPRRGPFSLSATPTILEKYKLDRPALTMITSETQHQHYVQVLTLGGEGCGGRRINTDQAFRLGQRFQGFADTVFVREADEEAS
jgi:hypothetical protein